VPLGFNTQQLSTVQRACVQIYGADLATDLTEHRNPSAIDSPARLPMTSIFIGYRYDRGGVAVMITISDVSLFACAHRSLCPPVHIDRLIEAPPSLVYGDFENFMDKFSTS